jgi:pilus assembly protein Flp/PilA
MGVGTLEIMMSWWVAQVRRVVPSERGASLIEYALLVALIALVCIAAVTLLGDETGSKFVSVSDSVSIAGND